MARVICLTCSCSYPAGAAVCPFCSGPLTPEAELNGAVNDRLINGMLPPEILEQARQTIDLEQLMAGVREIETTGGVQFEDFIGEIERRVKGG